MCLLACRVLRDIEAVRQEATLLKEQMQIVKEDIKRVCLPPGGGWVFTKGNVDFLYMATNQHDLID